MNTNNYPPRFSIIIPVYNVEKYVGYCLKSICDQDFDKSLFEVIVIDDCSPDSSSKVIESIITQHHDIKIKFLHHDVNKGIGGARNTGLNVAEGEYILWVDSDDCFVFKNTLSTLNEVLKNNDINVLRTQSYTSISSDDFTSLKTSAFSFALKVYSSHEYFNSSHFGLHVHSSAYKRKFLLENHMLFRENHSFEDSDWSYVVDYKAEKIYEIDYPFYGYRYRSESVTNNVSIKTFMDNAISVVESVNVASKITDPIIQRDIKQWIKVSLYSFIRISRLYPVKNSKNCISFAFRNTDLDLSEYITSAKDFIILNIMKYSPTLIILPIRLLFRLKCFLRNT